MEKLGVLMIIKKQEKFLMVNKRGNQEWNVPVAKREGNESMQENMIRGLKEQIGVGIGAIQGVYYSHYQIVSDNVVIVTLYPHTTCRPNKLLQIKTLRWNDMLDRLQNNVFVSQLEKMKKEGIL